MWSGLDLWKLMDISVFDLFRVGIGPSSSHTVGPMRAALEFVNQLEATSRLAQTQRLLITLYGSLAATGRGHATPEAILLGLSGYSPESADIAEGRIFLAKAKCGEPFLLAKQKSIVFDFLRDLRFSSACLPGHPNGMEFTAIDEFGQPLQTEKYYSIGGGFITKDPIGLRKISERPHNPLGFNSAKQLLELCKTSAMSISEFMYHRELKKHSKHEIESRLILILETMRNCVQKGLHTQGALPGALQVPRRAAKMYERLEQQNLTDHNVDSMSWLSVFAIAVSEENACGGRIVTAPTNGAAGIIPGVLAFYERFIPGASQQGAINFLMVAGGIGILYKLNASISGAEVGCQGEVGVACSMAAAGLCAALGGTNDQIENAAEIAMEHHLGLTCDPIGGRVQIPCIERNAMGAIKAVNSAKLALLGDGNHIVSLDKVIETMMQTGLDMQSKYKETSLGGLAVSVVEC